MYINDLYLHNFRNYRDQKIEFSRGINFLVGSNGQGKTNVLEGIYYLLTGKSYRVRQENELILWGEKSFYLQARFTVGSRLLKLESYYENKKKVMKINQVACRRLSDYVGTVNAVFFSPDDLSIIKKGPNERRKYLDLLIAQNRPSHIALLNSYLRIIKQKNTLLKTIRNLNSGKKQLEIWNKQLVETGSKIIKNRYEFTEKLQNHSEKIFGRIFSPEESIKLTYVSLGQKTLEEALAAFPEILEKKMDREVERQEVLYGPHRDDLLINLNDRSARLFASQGQQRSLVLCLKLAEMEIILKERDEYPILLLDDVLSELDELRREYLVKYINSSCKQTLITMTGSDRSIINETAAVFSVCQGHIRREQ